MKHFCLILDWNIFYGSKVGTKLSVTKSKRKGVGAFS